MDKREFVATALDKSKKTFLVYVAILISFNKGSRILIYLSQVAQIASLLADEALTQVFTKYSDYANVFSLEAIVKLLKHISINDYTIDLKKISSHLTALFIA